MSFRFAGMIGNAIADGSIGGMLGDVGMPFAEGLDKGILGALDGGLVGGLVGGEGDDIGDKLIGGLVGKYFGDQKGLAFEAMGFQGGGGPGEPGLIESTSAVESVDPPTEFGTVGIQSVIDDVTEPELDLEALRAMLSPGAGMSMLRRMS